VQSLSPAIVILINRLQPTGSGGGPVQFIDRDNVAQNQNVSITLHAPDAVAMFDALQPGITAATISIRARALERPAPQRNVIGVIRGSDPVLADTYVFLTAHYDHVGVRGTGADTIYNGANDDGSGTVSVIEIASALASLKERPKRSLVFMTVFGEEKGLLGSNYYVRHPIFPVEKIVADINLEQVGRTDSTEGPQVNNASITGFDYSDVGQILVSAGALTGITIYKHERNSDAYFSASDNAALARQGVPAHSFSVAFNYPDYHGPGDHWDKVDYDNMARVDRTVALGMLMIANNPEAPKWNEANPRTVPYVRAWKERHPSPAQ
jgi:Zn-dependent M28 family amino/carboxypeptidase